MRSGWVRKGPVGCARACRAAARGSASPLADPQVPLGPEDCPYQPLLGTIKKGVWGPEDCFMNLRGPHSRSQTW